MREAKSWCLHGSEALQQPITTAAWTVVLPQSFRPLQMFENNGMLLPAFMGEPCMLTLSDALIQIWESALLRPRRQFSYRTPVRPLATFPIEHADAVLFKAKRWYRQLTEGSQRSQRYCMASMSGYVSIPGSC